MNTKSNKLTISVQSGGLTATISFDFSELLLSPLDDTAGALNTDACIPVTGRHLGSEMLPKLHSMHYQALSSLYRELSEVRRDQT